MRADIKILLVLYKKQVKKYKRKLVSLRQAEAHFEEEGDEQVLKYLRDSIESFTERLDRTEKHIIRLNKKFGLESVKRFSY